MKSPQSPQSPVRFSETSAAESLLTHARNSRGAIRRTSYGFIYPLFKPHRAPSPRTPGRCSRPPPCSIARCVISVHLPYSHYTAISVTSSVGAQRTERRHPHYKSKVQVKPPVRLASGRAPIEAPMVRASGAHARATGIMSIVRHATLRLVTLCGPAPHVGRQVRCRRHKKRRRPTALVRRRRGVCAHIAW